MAQFVEHKHVMIITPEPVGPAGKILNANFTALADRDDELQQAIDQIELTPGPQGPAGPTGPQGPRGSQGDQGIQGPAGPQGLQGLQGLKGDTGATGLQGDKGDTGEPGPQGIQGPIGLTGPQGELGDKGPEGPQGIQGPKGDPGDPATNLIETVNGQTGQVVLGVGEIYNLQDALDAKAGTVHVHSSEDLYYEYGYGNYVYPGPTVGETLYTLDQAISYVDYSLNSFYARTDSGNTFDGDQHVTGVLYLDKDINSLYTHTTVLEGDGWTIGGYNHFTNPPAINATTLRITANNRMELQAGYALLFNAQNFEFPSGYLFSYIANQLYLKSGEIILQTNIENTTIFHGGAWRDTIIRPYVGGYRIVLEGPTAVKGGTLEGTQLSSTNAERQVGATTFVWADSTDATRRGRVIQSVTDSTLAREVVRHESDGSRGYQIQTVHTTAPADSMLPSGSVSFYADASGNLKIKLKDASGTVRAGTVMLT